MSTQDTDFVKEHEQHTENQPEQNLSLCYAYPIINQDQGNSVLTTNKKSPRKLIQETNVAEDGLYASDSPFVYNDIESFQFDTMKTLEYKSKPKFHGKLIEIVIREVNINTLGDQLEIEITSVCLIFKKKVICKANSPFNRKLHKLLIRNTECNNLSIQVYTKSGQSSILPLPLLKRNVENNKVEIDFAISDNLGRIHAGTIVCTVTINNYGEQKQEPYTFQMYKLSNDPNDPQNSLSLLRPPKNICKKEVKYFLLRDPALMFDVDSEVTIPKKIQAEEVKPPDIVVTEPSAFSLLDTLFRNLFQIKHPLESSTGTRRHHTVGKTVLTVTILRGIEIPIREESALVQPFVEVEWGNTVHTTSIAEGPAPHNLKYDVKSSKEWRSIDTAVPAKADHNVQTLELHVTDEEVKQIKKTAMDIEQCLKDKLAHWRSTIGLTTIFNRHATTILRSSISKIEPFSEIQLGKKDLKQLYRAYHIHGFVLNKRECHIDELSKDMYATKIHNISGPVEFAIACYIQPYVGKISSIWIAIIILRSHH